ncbi:unnamed protein product [Musa textilis]
MHEPSAQSVYHCASSPFCQEHQLQGRSLNADHLKILLCYDSERERELISFVQISGDYGSQGMSGRDFMNERKVKDLLHGSEYVPTYEDKDGDWMLVGDVPWEMFVASCKRLSIMKGSEAIGLEPRAMEKCKNKC